ncbi:P-loop containing nucleoside triphosphate hydrolase protein, partial [Meredithblackwellia eburnea MCA 4105]
MSPFSTLESRLKYPNKHKLQRIIDDVSTSTIELACPAQTLDSFLPVLGNSTTTPSSDHSSYPSSPLRHQHPDYNPLNPSYGDDAQGGIISTGDQGLDAVFQGGLRLGTVTELVGESASGKSHLCLQFSLQAQLPPVQGGVLGGVIYITSEGLLPTTRLRELARFRCGEEDNQEGEGMMDNIHVTKAEDTESLIQLLASFVPAQIARQRER